MSDREESGQKLLAVVASEKLEAQDEPYFEQLPVAEVVETETAVPVQGGASNKISDLDRQIAEIKKAIAIQQEVTNRKLSEQAQKEQEEKEQKEQ